MCFYFRAASFAFVDCINTYTNIYTYLSLCRKRERERKKEGKGGARRGSERGRPGRIHQAIRPPSEAAFCSTTNGVHCAGSEAARGASSSKSLYSYLL